MTLLVLGVVGGLAGARDAIIDELGDAAQAMLALDDSYSIDWPLEIADRPGRHRRPRPGGGRPGQRLELHRRLGLHRLRPRDAAGRTAGQSGRRLVT